MSADFKTVCLQWVGDDNGGDGQQDERPGGGGQLSQATHWSWHCKVRFSIELTATARILFVKNFSGIHEQSFYQSVS